MKSINEDQSDVDMDGIGDACDVVDTDNELIQEFVLYPNPTRGLLHIDSNSSLQFKVFNIQSERVMKDKIESDRIDISHLPPGLYILELFDESKSYGFNKIIKY